MPTLIKLTSSSGTRRCDATCHNAEHPDCDCVCGGRYHGKGRTPGELERAVQAFGDEILEGLRGRGDVRRRPPSLFDAPLEE